MSPSKNWGERLAAPQGRKKALPRNPAQRYASSHWGIPHERVYHLPVPGVGARTALVEMGKLVELETTDGGVLELPHPDDAPTKDLTVLVFSPRTDERLHIAVPAHIRQELADTLIDPGGAWYPLAAVAAATGGRHAKGKYHDVLVQAIGPLESVIYVTEKGEDDISNYWHTLGEESQIKPFLAVDASGNLYIAGGNYTVPDEGITD